MGLLRFERRSMVPEAYFFPVDKTQLDALSDNYYHIVYILIISFIYCRCYIKLVEFGINCKKKLLIQ